jgi:hypothetical protein
MTQNPAEKLCAFVIREYGRRLTPTQLRWPWTYIGTYNGEISGVVIDADGTSSGYRVMLADMGLASFSDGAEQPELDLA